MFTLTQNRWKIDDVLGVWPLHGLCGAWGGIAAGIFGAKALGGLGGVALGVAGHRHAARHRGRVGRAAPSCMARSRRRSGCGSIAEEEFNGADLSIHKIGATNDRETAW